ncbi:MAG TPA: hypothetical protein VEZ55_15425 [Chitinophagaceae bacterium]|nr:hypothetical protein [Chitinophagaceae bacterium]
MHERLNDEGKKDVIIVAGAILLSWLTLLYYYGKEISVNIGGFYSTNTKSPELAAIGLTYFKGFIL